LDASYWLNFSLNHGNAQWAGSGGDTTVEAGFFVGPRRKDSAWGLTKSPLSLIFTM
jgi:hypothetical protein